MQSVKCKVEQPAGDHPYEVRIILAQLCVILVLILVILALILVILA